MNEQVRHTSRTAQDGGGGLGDPFAAAVDAGVIEVHHGLHSEDLPAGEMTVGEIRARYRDRFGIPEGTPAFVEGAPADERTVVRAGERLVFSRHRGQKGARARRSARRADGRAHGRA